MVYKEREFLYINLATSRYIQPAHRISDTTIGRDQADFALVFDRNIRNTAEGKDNKRIDEGTNVRV